MSIKPIIYASTDVDVQIAIDSGLLLSDIVDMEVVLKSETLTRTYTLLGGQIAKVSTYLVLSIPKTSITQPGIYEVKITYTDAANKVRSLSASRYYLEFK